MTKPKSKPVKSKAPVKVARKPARAAINKKGTASKKTRKKTVTLSKSKAITIAFSVAAFIYLVYQIYILVSAVN